MKKAEFPPIKVSGFATSNNAELNLIAINFESGDMRSALCFTPKMTKELIAGLKKSLSRLEQRKN